jgi:hypothetical protein
VILKSYYYIYSMKTKKPKRGRKPLEDKKIQIPIYVNESVVTKLGGVDNIRAHCYHAIGLAKQTKDVLSQMGK